MLPDSATVPMPLLMVADVAFAEVHDKVALAPAVIVVGEAANVTVGAAGAPDTPTQLANNPVVKIKAKDRSRCELRRRSLFMSAFGCSKAGSELHGRKLFCAE